MQIQLQESNNHLSTRNQQQFLGTAFANRKRRILLENDCELLQPIRDYYRKRPIQYLSRPQPAYIKKQESEILGGRNASIMKQLEYLRGNVKDAFGLGDVEQIIRQQKEGRELVKKKRNCSGIIKNKLYYTQNQKVKCIQFLISKDLNSHTSAISSSTVRVSDPVVVFSCQQQILQLIIINEKQQLLALRTRDSLILYNCSEGQKSFHKNFIGQIISSVQNYWDNSSLDVVTLQTDNKMSLVSINTLTSDISNLHQAEQQIVSLWRISSQQIFYCQNFAAGVIDVRTNSKNKMNLNFESYRISQGCLERMYESIPLRSKDKVNPYFAIAGGLSIGIFDIRFTGSPVLRLRHMCDQAPPVSLQYFAGNNEPLFSDFEAQFLQLLHRKDQGQIDKQSHSILIGHNPYPRGSVIFTSLNLERRQNVKGYISQIFFGELDYHPNQLRFLFDSGKLMRGVHPRSLSAYSCGKELFFFQIDSQGGVTIQNFSQIESAYHQKLIETSHSRLDQSQWKSLRLLAGLEIDQIGKGVYDLQFGKLVEEQTERYVTVQQQQSEVRADLEDDLDIGIQSAIDKLNIEQESEESCEDQLQPKPKTNITYFNMKKFWQKISNLSMHQADKKDMNPTMEQEQSHPHQIQQHQGNVIQQGSYPLQEGMNLQEKEIPDFRQTRENMRKYLKNPNKSQNINYDQNNIFEQW